MSKQGTARPEWTHTKPQNDTWPVPETQGKAKHGKKSTSPVISGSNGPELKVYHNHKGDGSVVGQRRTQLQHALNMD